MKSRSVNIIFILLIVLLLIARQWIEIHLLAFVFLTVVYIGIHLYGSITISSQFYLTARCRANVPTHSIALTFDDGPAGAGTTEILRILKDHQVKATFFCIGKNVKQDPTLTLEIHQAGHLIGNHSYFHGPFFDLQSKKKMMSELEATNQVIEDTIGYRPRFFRPPYGVTNPMLAAAVNHLNQLAVGWSVRSFDTVASNRKKLFDRVTKNLQAGDIILFHDRCRITQAVLPDILQYIQKKGMTIDTVDHLIGEKAYM